MGAVSKYLIYATLGAISGGLFMPYVIIYVLTIIPNSYALIGILLGASMLVGSVLHYPFGILTDKIGRKAPMFIGGLGSSFALYLLMNATSLQDLMLIIPVSALFGALAGSAEGALRQEVTEGGEQGTKMAGMGLILKMVYAASVLVGGVLIQSRGFPFTFKVVIAFSLLATFSVLILEGNGKGGSGG